MFDCGMFIPPDTAELTRKKNVNKWSQDVQVVHVVFCCSQVRQVSKDDLME